MAEGIVTVGGGHTWETDLVTALDRPGAPLTVIRRCADMSDLLAVAAAGQVAACVVAADVRRLDTEAISRLAGFGVAVVAVYRADRPAATARLGRIGIIHSITDDATGADIESAVREAIATTGDPEGATASRVAGDPTWAWTAVPPDDPASREPDPVSGRDDDASDGTPGRHHTEVPTARRSADTTAVRGDDGPTATSDGVPGAGAPEGRIVAVWGPGGAPGRSTVAMGLADQVAASGRSVMLVDGDVYGGLLASAYGLLDESAGLAGACRLAANGRLDVGSLLALSWRIADRWSLLTGVSRADRWPEIRPSAVPAVMTLCRSIAAVTVVDCAAPLETDEEISFDTMAPRRNGATLALLAAADTIVVVGSADPPGLQRLVRGLAELAAATGSSRPRIVLNRVRRTAASEAELVTALRRFAGVGPDVLLPEDRAACDLAWKRAVRLSAAAPGSPLVAALQRLSALVCPAA